MKQRCLITIFFFSLTSSAQFRNIQIDAGFSPNEPSIAIDPGNPAHIMAGANMDHCYTSSDGGLSWQKDYIRSAYGVWGDPVIIADSSGAFYYFHLSDMSSSHTFGAPGWVDRMVCQRMDHFSGTWSSDSYAGLDSPRVQDKPGVAYDRVRDKIYLAWTQFDKYGSNRSTDSSLILFSSSSDHGTTWSKPVRLSTKGGDCLDRDGTVEGAVPCVGPAGEIYVSWASADGIVFKKSLDGGVSWPPQETLVTAVPGGWDYYVYGLQRCNGLPYTACDLSNSPYRGNLYINWSDLRSGNPDIWLSRSTDKGATWSAPIRVNDDTAGPFGNDQFMSSMTIDQATGYIYVLFYDRRNEVVDGETEVYMAISKDGGNTFRNVKVSQQKFIPSSGFFLGDYTGISVHNGMVRPIWTRMDAGKTSIWTAIADSALDIAGINASATALQPLYPNPFSSDVVIPFSLTSMCQVTLTVTDIYGRKVASLLSQKQLPPGNYAEHFYPGQRGIVPGFYMFILEAGNTRTVQKALYQE